MDKTFIKIIKFISAIILFFFGSLLQLIPIGIFNLDINNLTDNTIILLNLYSSVVIIIILFLLYRKEIIVNIKDFCKHKSEFFETSFKYWLLGLVFMAFFNIIINLFSPNEISNNEEAIRNMISVSPYIMFISTVLAAPILEELVFRKAFRTIIKNNILFILISGILFGALHVIGSVDNLYDYLYILPYSSLGISFAYIYYKTNNIVSPILMHMIHNTIMTLMAIFLSGMIL